MRAVPPLPLRPQTPQECHQPALRTVKRGNGPGGRLEGLRRLLPQKAGCVGGKLQRRGGLPAAGPLGVQNKCSPKGLGLTREAKPGLEADPSPAHRELHAHWDGRPHMEPGPEPSRGGTCLSGQRSICPTLPVWPSPREVTTGVVISERVGTFQAGDSTAPEASTALSVSSPLGHLCKPQGLPLNCGGRVLGTGSHGIWLESLTAALGASDRNPGPLLGTLGRPKGALFSLFPRLTRAQLAGQSGAPG